MQVKSYEDKPPILSIENYSFGYESDRKQPILSNLDFSLYKNQVTLLMGKSGSGKSTIALCLNGLYPEAVEGYSEGEIYYKGVNIKSFPKGQLNQHIAVVFQDPESQFCMMTVEDELAFTLENLNTPPSEMDEQISEVLRKVSMEGYRKSKLHELSGGQKQKIALAAVFLLQPDVLILDEATANLDPVSSLEFVMLIRNVQKNTGMTVLIIDHKADDWLDITDRLLVLGSEGTLIADSEPDSIFTEQKHLLINEGIFLPKQYHLPEQFIQKRENSGAANEKIIDIQDVTFSRRKSIILNQINLDIRRGELLMIVGENGAGKSTLLEIMAGLIKPHQGKILFNNRQIQKWKVADLRKRIGYVFQNPEHQFITDTVYDEITFGMKLNEVPTEAIQNKAEFLIEQFHLQKQKYSNPFSLSGGQKRRLSVATMLDETPDLLIFDEPTFGQDASTTSELMNIVQDLKANGTAIVFVTHDMELVNMADRVMVLHKGENSFIGRPDELWQQEELVKKARLQLPYSVRNNQIEGEIYDIVY